MSHTNSFITYWKPETIGELKAQVMPLCRAKFSGQLHCFIRNAFDFWLRCFYCLGYTIVVS